MPHNTPQDFDKLWIELNSSEAANFCSDDNTYFHIKNKLEQVVLERIIKSLQFPQAKKTAVDLGCGTGRLSFFLETFGFQTLGIDWSLEFLNHALITKNNIGSNVDFKNSDVIEFMEHSNQKYNLVIASGLLTSYNDEQVKRFFQLIQNITSPESIILIKEHIPKRKTVTKTIKNIAVKFRPAIFWKTLFSEFNISANFILCDPIFYSFLGSLTIYPKILPFLQKLNLLLYFPDFFVNKVRTYWIICSYKK